MTIYFITDEDEKYVKIGYVEGGSARARLSTLQTGSPLRLKIFTEIEGGEHMEKELHKMFDSFRTVGEWFVFNEEIRSFIRALNNLSPMATFYKKLYLKKGMPERKALVNFLDREKDTDPPLNTIPGPQARLRMRTIERLKRVAELSNDLTQIEIADILGCSLTTIKRDYKQLNGTVTK